MKGVTCHFGLLSTGAEPSPQASETGSSASGSQSASLLSFILFIHPLVILVTG